MSGTRDQPPSEEVPSEAALVERFLAWCSEKVGYSAPDTPSEAMTFTSLQEFLFVSRVVDTIPNAEGFIESLRPPPGRFVTWTDFCIILELIAQARFPSSEPTVAIVKVVDEIVHFVPPKKLASKAATGRGGCESGLLRRDSSLAELEPREVAPVAVPPQHSTPKKKESRQQRPYMPKQLDEAVIALRDYMESHSVTELCVAMQLPTALSSKFHESDDPLKDFFASPAALWDAICSCAPRTFPQSNPVAAEELTLQVILNSLHRVL